VTGTYVDLVNRIADELLIGATITTAQIKLEILSAIQHYERERFWFNEAQATASTVSGVNSVAAPTDMLEIDTLDVTYGGRPYPVRRRDWAWYSRLGLRDTTVGRSVPGQYVYYNQTLFLYPVPNDAYVLLISYVKQLTTLSADADTNAWTTDAEALIRTRARQALKLNYQNDDTAMQMVAAMEAAGKDYLSPLEELAYRSLMHSTTARVSSGRIASTPGF